MKVLFVSSGNNADGISSIVRAQALSLTNAGVHVDFYMILGHGFRGYINAVKKLKSRFTSGNYDVVHAHYSLSGFACTLAGVKPLIVSLMGSDVLKTGWKRWLIFLFGKSLWYKIIVKSEEMQQILGMPNVEVIPNGVDFSLFHPIDRETSRAKLGWNSTKIHILFPADPKRSEKNFKLFSSAVNILQNINIEIHFLDKIPHHQVNDYYNASDVIVLTSRREGSPNVIKEAMACNKPIVATNVGDIKLLFDNVQGCFVTSFDINETAENITKAIDFAITKCHTSGLMRLQNLGLSSEEVAEKIKNIYESSIRRA